MYHSQSSLETKMEGLDTSGPSSSRTAQVQTSPREPTIESRRPSSPVRSPSLKGKEVARESKFPEEEDEEILKESNSRFVLFPIKYREVSYHSRVRARQFALS